MTVASPSAVAALTIERRPLDAIPRDDWDALAAANPWATPFSAWAFHRAWWDAYGENAHEETLVALDPDGRLRGIVPLMHRHQVEPADAATHTTMRHGHPAELTPVAPTAKSIFFGASYHADYATLLCAPTDLAAVAEALATHLADGTVDDPGHRVPWDALDLRRLRAGDPAADALVAALGRREMSAGWTLNVEQEDVCPVLTLPEGADYEGFLGTLGKKDRHEVRRKVRRAEAAGEVVLAESPEPLADLESFIDLHQRRWGDDGLFPDTPGGAQSRVLFHRLFELFGAGGPLRLTFLTVAGRRVASGVHFETDDAYLYYNAGVDLEARDLSPGVVLAARYVERAIAAGKRRLDFLRGDELYKYEWGSLDEPISRLLVRRTPASPSTAVPA